MPRYTDPLKMSYLEVDDGDSDRVLIVYDIEYEPATRGSYDEPPCEAVISYGKVYIQGWPELGNQLPRDIKVWGESEKALDALVRKAIAREFEQ